MNTSVTSALARTDPQRGNSLIEVMLSLVVLGAGLVGATRMQSAILDAQCTAREHAIFAAKLTQVVESLQAYSSNTCCDPAAGTCGTIGSDFSITRTVPPSSKVCTYTIAYTPAGNSCVSDGTVTSKMTTVTFFPRESAGGTTGGGGSGINIPTPVIASIKNRDTGTSNAQSLDGVAVDNGTDVNIGVAIRRDAEGKYILYAKNESSGNYFERLNSNVELVRISGVLFFTTSDDSSIQILRSSNGLSIFSSGTGFCQFPLYYGSANDPSTYRINGLPSDTKSAAYICYVPEGWYGNVGIDFNNIPNKVWACPDGTPDNNNLYGGFRSIKAIFSNPAPPQTAADIKGQSGVLTRHQSSLTGLHFVLYQAKQKSTCPAIIQNKTKQGVVQGLTFASHSSPANSITLKSVGYGDVRQVKATASITPSTSGMQGVECRTDVQCLKPLDYWVEVVGLTEVKGTLERTSGATFLWKNIVLLANRASPYGGTFSSACAVDAVSDEEQTTRSSVGFTCYAGQGDAVTLGVPEGSGAKVADTSPAQVLTYTAPTSGVTLKLADAP